MTEPVPPAPAPAPALSGTAPPPQGLRRVLANLAHLLGGKAAAGLMSLVYLVLVARTLGVRDYGILVLINGYVVFIGSVLAFSGFHGVVRYGSLALARGDAPALARLVRLMTVIELGCGLFAILVAALLVPIVGPRFGWPPEALRLALPYSLAVIATVRATPQGLLQIAGRFDLIGLHQAVSPVVRLIGALLAWALGAGLPGFLLVWFVSALAEGVAMWLLGLIAWRRLTARAPLAGPWRGGGEPGFGRFILVTNFDITLRELAPNLAPLTVGWLLGPAAAGLFTLAQRATTALQQPAVLLAQASYSVLADLVAQRRLALLRTTVWRSAGLALAVAVPFVAALALAAGGLLPLIGGRSFHGGVALVTLLAFARGLGLVAAPIGAGLTALGLPQRSAAATLVANLALYPLLPLLILIDGINGAGWHALGQNLVAALLLAFFFRRDSHAA
ncbi:lipopolysaccharide biosynthesis protein [Sphingomonas morindae]|uniref:Lipopolysaccharide biosynthesis protein n=1 Tax=Sphingomonas morindae TaxID=1541170 RepID=A0ABY4X875_9SPHN|nr:lipopolysaccharide biosynthesis protein [Sphingomonas morindae]USI73148.1 lipopolysaccharide biosynthesis protein [Sphingomonas morindae]